MSKEFVPSDPDADGDADRDDTVQSEPAATGDDDAVSPTSLVFGMGSAPEDVEPRIEPNERDALEAADVDPAAVENKEYSYRMLLDAGVDDDVADALRRRFSLPWSFENDGDLDRRSAAVRGLDDAEREWIAVSGDEKWQSFDYARSRTIDVDRDEPAERPWPKPTPVTAVTGVGPDDADRLAEAGIVSAERLATINAFDVAKVLDLNVLHVRTWRHNAREVLATRHD